MFLIISAYLRKQRPGFDRVESLVNGEHLIDRQFIKQKYKMGALRRYHIINKNICRCMPYICEENIGEFFT